ncbi:MAG: GAF domain-containing protein, partial [Nitrospirota bacterium]
MGTPSSPVDSLRIIGTLIACKGLHEFEQTLSHELVRILKCDLIGFYLYSATAETFTPVSKLLTDPDSPGYLIGQLPAAGTMKEAVIQRGQAVLEHDLARSAWAESAVLKSASFKTASVITAPLPAAPSPTQACPQAIAVMSAITIGKANAFSEDDRLFLETLGVQLAPVLQQVLAVEERDALMAINSQVVVGTMTIEQLMPVVRGMLHRVVRQDMTGLVRFVPSPQGPWFDILYRESVDIDLAQLRRFPFERMAPAEMMATGKPLLITGHNHERFPERAYIESIGILSCILCPLIVRGAPYGFLAIGSKRRNAFSERDLAFTEQIGFHLSQAITNITAYEE